MNELLTCIRCKKEVAPKAGYYNHPSGIVCTSCWSEKDEKRFDQAFKNVAKSLRK